MKNLKHLFFLLSAVCVLSLSSCKDDDDDVSPNVSLLTNGEWVGNAVYFNGRNVTAEFEQDLGIKISLLSSKFERNGSYKTSYPGIPAEDGTWEYENGERVILFDKGAQEYRVVISKLDEDELFYVDGGAELRFMRKK